MPSAQDIPCASSHLFYCLANAAIPAADASPIAVAMAPRATALLTPILEPLVKVRHTQPVVACVRVCMRVCMHVYVRAASYAPARRVAVTWMDACVQKCFMLLLRDWPVRALFSHASGSNVIELLHFLHCKVLTMRPSPMILWAQQVLAEPGMTREDVTPMKFERCITAPLSAPVIGAKDMEDFLGELHNAARGFLDYDG